KRPIVYPYIPNSAPQLKREMLEAVNAESVADFYREIPDSLRLKEAMDLPEPFLSEYGLKRHMVSLLSKNKSCSDYLNFLGAGCWQHYVPAVCDEINGRDEFLTAYAGEPYEDHGRFQALFEYASQMAELLDMDVVNVPTYDWYQAAATSLRMAARITDRKEALVSALIDPHKLSMIREYCRPDLTIKLVGFDEDTGQLRLADLKEQISDKTAAVYFENPAFLGCLETQGDRIAALAHEQGAEVVVGVDPSSLGVLTPPSRYGADIVCGDLQPLGVHMSFGGGQSGFIATRDEEKYVMEYPSRLFGLVPTKVEGEYGFGDVAYERTSFAVREQGKEWVGTATALWAITAGVYLALMGPQGMLELGEGVLKRSHYAAARLNKIKGVKAPYLLSAFYKEFVVNFDDSGVPVSEINQALLDQGIMGGLDISGMFPELGNSALFCITEIHNKEDIDRLADSIGEILK
ncbi:MAG: aminomethyl-transferring glycine dehydrogenase subunit GcvPA, partial [Anaerolineales bacterium]